MQAEYSVVPCEEGRRKARLARDEEVERSETETNSYRRISQSELVEIREDLILHRDQPLESLEIRARYDLERETEKEESQSSSKLELAQDRGDANSHQQASSHYSQQPHQLLPPSSEPSPSSEPKPS